MNICSWLDLFILILFSCSQKVFLVTLKGGTFCSDEKFSLIRSKGLARIPKTKYEDEKDSIGKKCHFLAPALRSSEIFCSIKNAVEAVFKCAQRCPATAPRSQIATGLGVLSVGYALKQISKNNNNNVEIGNIYMRYGTALMTTASICADYRMQQILGNDLSECNIRSAIKLSKLCARNGGLYIKAAQHLSAMDHLLPEAYIKELVHLQDQAPATTRELIEELFRSELGKNFDEIFSDFCNFPIGSASIGQVHLAKLKSTGEQVAVKIQHPNIKRDSEIDLWAFSSALKIVKTLFPDFDLTWLVDEVRSCLDSELNFKKEAANSKKAKESFEKDPKLRKYVLIPKVYDQYTTERILMMQYIPGYKINDMERIEAAGIDPDNINKLMYEIFMEMIFKHQFIHCDPHPGNILINHDRKTGVVKIVLLDHGIYKTVTPQIIQTFSRLFLALLSRDSNEIELIASELKIEPEILAHFNNLIARMSQSRLDGIDPDELKYKLQREMINLMKEQDGDVNRQASDMLKSLPRELLFLIKVLDLLRSNERSLTRNSPKKLIRDSLMIITGYSMEAVEGKAGARNSFKIYFKLLEAYNRKRW